MKALLLLTALSIISPQTPQPTTRQIRQPVTLHVALNGKDTNPGSSDSPFRTIQFGVDALRPGDTLLIHGGTYREFVTITKSGAYFDRNVKVRAVPGEAVVIDGEGMDAPPGRSGLLEVAGADYLDVDGITVRNSPIAGIVVRGSWRVQVNRCETFNTARSGILIDKGQDVVVAN